MTKALFFAAVVFASPRKIWRDIRRDVELSRCVPSGSIQEQHCMGALYDVAADLVEMKLHGLCVDVRQGKRGAQIASSRPTTPSSTPPAKPG